MLELTLSDKSNLFSVVINALMTPTIYGTPPVLSASKKLISSSLNFETFNEEYVIQQVIQNYQRRKEAEKRAWKIGIGTVATLLGLGDGFQFSDLLLGAVAGNIGSNIASSLDNLDEEHLKELQLDWINHPESYIYHCKRHRGSALRRLLIMAPHPVMGIVSTAFAIQFPDNYIAYLIPVADIPGVFATSSNGLNLSITHQKQVLGRVQKDDGGYLYIEAGIDTQGQIFVTLPYNTPHQFPY